MISAEFIESNLDDWAAAERIVVGKKTVAGSPDIFVGVANSSVPKYLIELHTFDEIVCFKSIKVIGDNVVFGFGQFVHFLDGESGCINSVKLDTYFGHLYVPDDLEYEGDDFGVLVASAEYLHRFTPLGVEIWKSSHIGIDGVTVSNIEYPFIEASGEWDPPGGWVDVKINLEDGANAI